MATFSNWLKTFALLAALAGVLVGLGALAGRGAATVALGVAIAMNLGAFLWSDRLILAMHRAHPLPRERAPAVYAAVEELAARAGIPAPPIYLIDDPQPNAFATGRGPSHAAVAVTSGILRVLSPRELRGVLAHELAHVRNRDVLIASVAAAVAGAVTWLAHMIQWGAMFGFGGRDDDEGPGLIGTLALALLAPLAATVIQLAISRRREFGADAAGARLSGDPIALAAALEKLDAVASHVPSHTAEPATASLFIVSPLAASRLGRTLAGLFSTHPSTAERVARLREMAATDDLARHGSPSPRPQA